MRKKSFWFFHIVPILFLLITACNSTPSSPETSQIPSAEKESSIALDAQPSDTPSASDITLVWDSAFQTFLDGMIEYNEIEPATLMKLLNEEPPPFLLDVRAYAEITQAGRIEGSVVIPLRDLASAESIVLLPGFDTTIITYCGTGWRCAIAMTILGALGWNDVFSLTDGSYGGWVEAGYPIVAGLPESTPLNIAQPDSTLVARMDALLSDIPDGFGMVTPDVLLQAINDLPDLILIDVRRAYEIQEMGGIENAIQIPLESFIQLKGEWPQSKDAKVLVYSNNGHRSTIAMVILWTYGYRGVASLKGGFNAWVGAGYPVADVVVSE